MPACFPSMSLPPGSTARGGARESWRYYADRRIWVVQCIRGSYGFSVEAPSQREAWWKACQQAEAMDNRRFNA